jgi:hypothetical protein
MYCLGQILFILVILFILILIVCYISSINSSIQTNGKASPVRESNAPIQVNENTSKIKSCGCPDLVTWHPGQIKHKLYCPIFRKLNPNLTLKEFYKYEGFPNKEDEEWPKI